MGKTREEILARLRGEAGAPGTVDDPAQDESFFQRFLGAVRRAPERTRFDVGVENAGFAFAAGAMDLVGRDDLAERIRGFRERRDEEIEETGLGKLTGPLGRVAGEAALFLAPGQAVSKIPRVAQAGRGARLAARAASGAAVDAPIEAGERPEESFAGFLGLEGLSETAAGRAAVGVGTGLAFEGVGEAVGSLISGLRRGRGVAEAAAEAGQAQARQGDVLVSDVPPSFGAQDFDVKLNTIREDPEGLRSVAERVNRLKESGALPKNNRVTFEQLSERAQSVDLDDVLDAAPDKSLSDVEIVAIKQEYNESEKIVAELERLIATTEDGPLRATFARSLDEATARQDAMLRRYIPGLSQAGRDLSAARFRALSDRDPLRMAVEAERQAGRQLTAAEKSELRRLINEGDNQAIVKFMQSLQAPLTMRDPRFYTTLRKAGLISSVRSVGRAVFGNTARAAFDVSSRPAAAMMDAIFSGLFDSTRTTRLGSATGAAARARGIVEGLGESVGVLRGDVPREVAEKLEIPRNIRLKSINVGGIDPADAWSQLWFRLQGVADRPFWRSAYRGSISDQAEIVAKDVEGLAGDALRDRVKFLQKNPTAEMTARAGIEASYATFQNESLAGGVGVGIKEASARQGGRVAEAVADFIVPFSRTPGSIIGQSIESTPLGAIGTLSDIARMNGLVGPRGAGRADQETINALARLQRKAARRGGRWLTGLGAMLWGMKWAREGNATGPIPESPSERTQFLREGKRPFAVKLGDRWVSLTQIQPLGAVIGYGAQLQEQVGAEELSDLVSPGALASGLQAGGQIALETPFLTGARDAIRFLEDPTAAGSVAATAVGSLVPNFVADITRATDPEIKDVDATSVKGIVDAVLARVPGASKSVPARIDDLTGEPIVREESTGARIAQAFLDVPGTSQDRTVDDVVLQEMDRIGASIGGLRKKKDETPQAFRERQQFYGNIMGKVLTAFVEGDQRLLVEARVPLRDFREFRRLAQGEQTEETLREQEDIFENVARQLRSRITRDLNRNRPRRWERIRER